MDVSEDFKGTEYIFPLAAGFAFGSLPKSLLRHPGRELPRNQAAGTARTKVERPPKGKRDGQSGAVTV